MAIPSSGNVSIKSAAGSGRSIDTEVQSVSSGSLVTLSTNAVTSGNTIDGASPHSMREFMGYTHILPDFTWTVHEPNSATDKGRQMSSGTQASDGSNNGSTGNAMDLYTNYANNSYIVRAYCATTVQWQWSGNNQRVVTIRIADTYSWTSTGHERVYLNNGNYTTPSENTFYTIYDITLNQTPTHYRVTRSETQNNNTFGTGGVVGGMRSFGAGSGSGSQITTGSWQAWPTSAVNLSERCFIEAEIEDADWGGTSADWESQVSYKLEVRDTSNRSDTHISTHGHKTRSRAMYNGW